MNEILSFYLHSSKFCVKLHKKHNFTSILGSFHLFSQQQVSHMWRRVPGDF